MSPAWRRAPRPLALAVEQLASRLAPATVLADVQRVWEASVGPAVAREAAPVAEREGVVTVRCSSAVWAHELELLGPSLVGSLNAHLPTAPVRALRCRVE